MLYVRFFLFYSLLGLFNRVNIQLVIRDAAQILESELAVFIDYVAVPAAFLGEGERAGVEVVVPVVNLVQRNVRVSRKVYISRREEGFILVAVRKVDIQSVAKYSAEIGKNGEGKKRLVYLRVAVSTRANNLSLDGFK